MTVEPSEAPTAPKRRSRWKLWTWLAVIVTLLAVATVTVVVEANTYRDAPPLSFAGGLLGWAPSAGPTRTIDAGPWTALQVRPRPGHAQSFYATISNTSSVTQTILGERYPSRAPYQAEPTHLAVAESKGSIAADQAGDTGTYTYTTRPTSIAPGDARYIRYTIDTARHVWSRGRTEDWDGLILKVRVGMFTRTETVDFGDTAFVIHGALVTH